MIVVLTVKVDIKNGRMILHNKPATHNEMTIRTAEEIVCDAIQKHSSEEQLELIDVSVDKAQTVAENIL